MKLCPKCDRLIAEGIPNCPVCGSDIGSGRTHIDDYRILDILHEGHASLLCKALRERTNEIVMIRLFTAESGVNNEVAFRLQREIELLKQLPDNGFVRHYAMRKSSDGLWYRISEWVDAESWGSLLASGRLRNLHLTLGLLHQMALILSSLHEKSQIIPHLILNDIIVTEDESGDLTVKIDYKFSRFLDPKLDQPGSMLKRLLAVHPDILDGRPLDFRTDIWSLGKIFVEILSADLEVDNYLEKVKELGLPAELKILLKVMLADDPDLRPQSLKEVADALLRIRQGEQPGGIDGPVPATGAAGLVRRLQRNQRLLAAMVVALCLGVLLAWFVLNRRPQDPATVLETYANQYAQSVGFLVAEYGLKVNGLSIYVQRAEGTAFLVDPEGYLLTSRHVVCPWLEDARLEAVAQHYSQQGLAPAFHHRIYLWFEGQRAFNPAARALEAPEIDDVYFLENAYGTEAARRLIISGVAKSPVRIRQLLASPLKDDVAVLKIDPPEDRTPLPLDLGKAHLEIPKLSRIIALGFPLGSRVQAEVVNVSVVRGHVRRALKSMIQIDASLHSGNSGGPVIDARGKVIGIVAAVAMDYSEGIIPMATPVWDMGMILPISTAASLLADLKAGKVKWNGVPDYSIDRTLDGVREKAFDGNWIDAVSLVDEKLTDNLYPPLVTASGMLHFSMGAYADARLRFNQALSIDGDDHRAAFMLYLIDWLEDNAATSDQRQRLMTADWRSPAEFQGHLARLLENQVELPLGLSGYNGMENSWLRLISGFLSIRQGDWETAEKRLRDALLAADTKSWEYLLAMARLADVQKKRRSGLTRAQLKVYNQDIDRFEARVRQERDQQAIRRKEQSELLVKLSATGTALSEQRQILEAILALDPANRYLLAMIAYTAAAGDDWDEARKHIQTFLEPSGREIAVQLGLRLLEAGVVRHQGDGQEAREILLEFVRDTRNPWYVSIAEYLSGRIGAEVLQRQAEQSPEQLVSAYALMGFWAEAQENKPAAMRYYKQALGSFMDDWLEYDFANERLRRLRQSPD
jgi:S1-C subfamily serine protease/tetratricopeptide (TPR) repeat protein